MSESNASVPPASSGAAPATQSKTLSIISLVTGIIGLFGSLFLFGFLFSVTAVVLGHLGQRREPAAQGFWLTGLITGYLGVLVVVGIFILGAIGLSMGFGQMGGTTGTTAP